MSIFYPTIMVKSVKDITKQMLDDMGVTALILDVDNTLTTHNAHHQIAPEVRRWLDSMRGHGIGLVILSNNAKYRIRPFAQRQGLDFTANAMKPLPFGYARAVRLLKTTKRQVAIVGDQIFTDVLGGNLYGAKSILVEPLGPESNPLIRIKRIFEVGILRRYRKMEKKQ